MRAGRVRGRVSGRVSGRTVLSDNVYLLLSSPLSERISNDCLPRRNKDQLDTSRLH